MSTYVTWMALILQEDFDISLKTYYAFACKYILSALLCYDETWRQQLRTSRWSNLRVLLLIWVVSQVKSTEYILTFPNRPLKLAYACSDSVQYNCMTMFVDLRPVQQHGITTVTLADWLIRIILHIQIVGNCFPE